MGHKETKEWLKENEMTEREEKEQDNELKRRIFEIRKERNKTRREVGSGAAPDRENPPKRRKVEKEQYNKVMPDQRSEQTKRHQACPTSEDRPKKRKRADIREHLLSKPRKSPEKTMGGGSGDPVQGKASPIPKKCPEKEQSTEIRRMSRSIIEECLEEILRGGGDPEIVGEAPPDVHFGPWDYNNEVVDWERIKAERDQKIKEQEAAREKRIELANRLEKSWDMIRICKAIIKEHGPGWQESKEKREQQRKLEVEKAVRLKRAEMGRNEVIQRVTEEKILKITSMLPSKSRTRLENEESRDKRILLQETKTNLWKKWRGRIPTKQEYQHLEKKERLEMQLKKIEKELEKYRQDQDNQKEQERREQERRSKYIAEKKYKENERIEKEKEKTKKIQRKKLLEKHWEMLRWLNNFMEENKETWEELDIANKLEMEVMEKGEEWKKPNEQEKRKEVCDVMTREEKLKLANQKRAGWREWREPKDKILPSPPKRKRDQSEGIQSAKPTKRIKEGTYRGPSENNTHLGGPNPVTNLNMDCGPVNWGTCEQKTAFKIQISEVKHNKLSDIKEESTWWNKARDNKVRREGGGGGSGEVRRSGSHAPTSLKAPKNNKRLEKLAGERGGTPPPM